MTLPERLRDLRRLPLRAPALVAMAIAALVYFPGLGAMPFIDPPEGFHAEIAREMVSSGDWVLPRLNGVRYFSKPPVPYWLMALSFTVGGPTPFAARVWSALAAVALAGLTARIGAFLGGPRLGLLAGVLVSANLGVFVFGRLLKPDLLFILAIALAFTGFGLAYAAGRRWGLALFYAGLGAAAITKDVLGALGPAAAVAAFLWWSGERDVRRWVPWWGVGLFAAVAVPWYVAMEVRSPGFLWFTVADVHLLNFTRRRSFPDEDVPLSTLEFLGVTALAFLPWALMVPAAIARVVRTAAQSVQDRLWQLVAVWAVGVIALFAVSPFRLPHYGLPAFPALALLAARAWSEATDGAARARPGARRLAPVLAAFALGAVLFAVARAGMLPDTRAAWQAVDLAARNAAARGQAAESLLERFRPLLGGIGLTLGVGTLLAALALARRRAGAAMAVAVATMLAFLLLAGRGVARFAEARSVRPIAEALARQVRPGDVVIHEGPLENSASLLLGLRAPMPVVGGTASNLAYGATFADGRERFWSPERLGREWEAGRRFLVSAVAPDRSVVGALPAGSARLLVAAGGRRLYANAKAAGSAP
ncbi:MAG TPA: hypothetical protein DDZ42_17150 [Candidatus Rokubacteria bacterium]|nr:MAG: hypothetical protein A2050_01030 [Candidatus Rokubacteria bacterium GWA2_73_35]HBH03619.1 hypothetical protein [Candidatus Rokubacteria bacterium]